MGSAGWTYLEKRTHHVHPPHLALQVIKHVIGVGRSDVTIVAGRGHAVGGGLRRWEWHGFQWNAFSWSRSWKKRTHLRNEDWQREDIKDHTIFKKRCTHLSKAGGSSAWRRGLLGRIPAVPPSKEPWPSELPLSYDAASQLKDERRDLFNIANLH